MFAKALVTTPKNRLSEPPSCGPFSPLSCCNWGRCHFFFCYLPAGHWDNHAQQTLLYHLTNYRITCVCSDTFAQRFHQGNHIAPYQYRAREEFNEGCLIFQKFFSAKKDFIGPHKLTMNKVSPANSASPINQLMHAGV